MDRKIIEQKIIDNKFSTSIRCNSNDKFKDLFEEIYLEGMLAGYKLAISRLQNLDLIPTNDGRQYIDKNIDKIRALLSLCEEYEGCDKTIQQRNE